MRSFGDVVSLSDVHKSRAPRDFPLQVSIEPNAWCIAADPTTELEQELLAVFSRYRFASSGRPFRDTEFQSYLISAFRRLFLNIQFLTQRYDRFIICYSLNTRARQVVLLAIFDSEDPGDGGGQRMSGRPREGSRGVLRASGGRVLRNLRQFSLSTVSQMSLLPGIILTAAHVANLAKSGFGESGFDRIPDDYGARPEAGDASVADESQDVVQMGRDATPGDASASSEEDLDKPSNPDARDAAETGAAMLPEMPSIPKAPENEYSAGDVLKDISVAAHANADSLRCTREPGVAHPDGGVVFVRMAHFDEIETLHDLTIRQFGTNIAPIETMQDVYRHNPESMWVIFRSMREDRSQSRLAGYYGFLHLNAAGLAALENKTLDPRAPNLSLLATGGERPAAIYIWAIVARQLSSLVVPLIGKGLGVKTYGGLPFYASADTMGRLTDVKSYGFRDTSEEARRPDDPLCARSKPKHDDSKPNRKLAARIASTPDDIAKVFALRAAVFMTEQYCPYDEEFNGNDYCATHILGLVDGEPAAVLRIRFFAEFAHIGRLAVMPKFRRTLISKNVVEEGIEICRRKGYRMLYGQAQKRLVKFWSRFGFQPIRKNANLTSSDYEYVEISAELAPHEDSTAITSDRYMIIPPEDIWESMWQEASALDFPTMLPSSNPH